MKLEIDMTKDNLLPQNAVDILRDRYMLPEELSPQESFARACMGKARRSDISKTQMLILQ